MALDTARSMDIDGRIVKIPRKLSEDGYTNTDDLLIHTPPLRKPAKMRLSVVRRTCREDNALEQEFPLTERKRALFEPLGPSTGRQPGSPDALLPPPDFESASYPRGWVVGKKRKLVNVDVVESMRRIAVQEMNRKDREITDLNEQLEEDSRTMEHLQMQLQQERAKRAHIERENVMLQGQINMLMTMIPDQEPEDGETFET